MLKNMGALGYPIERIISVMDIDDPELFKAQFENKDSDVAIAYKKGKDKAEYLIDIKLFEMATSGDLKAISVFESRKKQLQKISENKNQGTVLGDLF
jgi:hypothetical protein